MMLRILMKHFTFAMLVATGGFALTIYAQIDNGQKGFISIDCGLPLNSNYTEKHTGLNFISDDPFIDEDIGESTLLSATYRNDYQRQMWYVRRFPKGIRNCYTINVTSGTKYLIGTSFLYGNYDEKDTPPKFDLYLGANLWDTVNVTDAHHEVSLEIVHVPPQNYIHLCLVKTGSWTPFVSVIRLRPLNITYYKTEMGSLALVDRLDIGNTGRYGYRYPEDVHDRYWSPYLSHDWTSLNTSSTSNIDYADNQPPSKVMSTAATPKNPRDSLEYWLPDYTREYYVYMHFAELKLLKDDQLREFKISYNEEAWGKAPITPDYLSTHSRFNTESLLGGHAFSLYATDNSTLPPILNAIEVFMVKLFLESEADHNDAEAVTIIKTTYGVKRNWQGDPCTRGYLWEGLNCSYNGYEPPRIISLNLSSSELTGTIPPSISNLIMIENLDLSNNYFTGSVPDFLSKLPNLRVLNLENNSLNGSIPDALIEKSKQNILSFSVCGNQDLIAPVSCKSKTLKKKEKNKNILVIPVVASVVGIFVVLTTVAAIWWGLKRKRQHNIAKSSIQKGTLESGKQQFIYSDVLRITNNLEHVLGKGGFGTVYHGRMGHDTQVAVKLLSPLAVRGHEQFLAEVNLLMRVHHRNLTKLVGYCNDDGTKALIYEYMANGNLEAHLSDLNSCLYILKWEVRVQIALHAAQGLEYLHYGCKPPIVHRDVKSTNILLDENLQAKLSDFGLSKTFPTDSTNGSHISTIVAGSPGYLDPEYYVSNRLNEKSDVFSFGVVLLQIVTGRPAIDKSNENIHISQWVNSVLVNNGDIKSIVDPRLQGNFDVNSAWKAVELAINCVSHKSTHRPNMGQVVIELKQCLDSCTRKIDKGLAWSKEGMRGLTESKNSIEMKPLTNSITQISPPPR